MINYSKSVNFCFLAHIVLGIGMGACLRPSKKINRNSELTSQTSESPNADASISSSDPAIKRLLTKSCFPCHGENGSNQGGFGYALDPKKLIESGLVVPYKPEASLLYTRPRDGSMPPGNPLKTEDISIIQQWIAQGAPDFNAATQRRLVTSTEQFELMINSLNSTAEDKTDVRYLTLSHLYNENLAEEKLEIVRQAVSKLLNSLSTNPVVRKPEVIDPEKLILKIRLKDYGWTAQTWADIANFNPYAVALTSTPSFQTLKAFTGEPQFVFRADWFVARVSQPDLYHQTLKLPGNLKDMALQVSGIDPGQELKATTKNFVRSAFYESGVSSSNRSMDRFIGPKSGFWLSYDFASNSVDTNIFLNPLGPRLIHEGAAQVVKPMGERAFLNDGGEAIYNLPNGMLGFFVTTALGKRLEEAPPGIVSQTDFGKRYVVIKAGFSCFQCHHTGLIDKKDEVRDSANNSPGSFTLDEATLINQIYVAHETFSEAIRIDSNRHKKAMAEAGVTHGIDPIILTHIAYSSSVGLSTAMAETELSEASLKKAIQDDPTMNAPLNPMINGGLVNRNVFEFYYKDIMAKAIAGLALAPPALKLISPPGGSSGLALNAKLTVLLSNAIPPVSFLRLLEQDPQIIVKDQSGNLVSGSTTVNGEVIAFSPTTPWTPLTNFTAELRWPVSFTLGRSLVWNFQSGSLSDIDPPLVASLEPVQDSVITGVDSPINIGFSESMDSTSLNNIKFNLHSLNNPTLEIPGKLTFSDRNLRYEPNDALVRGETYEFLVTGKIRDQAGNPLAGEIRSRFTIKKPETVLEVVKSSPADGIQNHPINQAIIVVFNEEVQPGSISDNTLVIRDSRLARIAGSFSIKGGEVRFVPNPGLRPAEKYSLELTTSVRGVSGNRLKDAYSFSFTTEEITKPIIIRQSPNDTAVPQN